MLHNYSSLKLTIYDVLHLATYVVSPSNGGHASPKKELTGLMEEVRLSLSNNSVSLSLVFYNVQI